MNTAKKWLALLLACVMLFALVACTDDDSKNEETTTNDPLLTDPLIPPEDPTQDSKDDGAPQSPVPDGEELEMPQIPF